MDIFLVEPSGRGHLAQYTHGLCSGLAERGHDVALFTSREYELAEHAGSYSIKPQPGDRLTPLNCLVLAREVLRKGPDVVHFQWLPSPLVYYAGLRLLRRTTDAPLVYTAHHVIPHRRRLHHHSTYGKIYGLLDLVVTHSEQNRSRIMDVWALDRGKVRIVPYGEPTNMSRDSGDGCAEKRLLFFGHVNRQKGVHTLLEAMKYLDDEYRLTIAGEGASRIGNGDERVETADGYVPPQAKEAYFREHDLVVLPHEKPCTTPLLADARGTAKPAVVSDLVENRDEAACYSFRAGDPEDLAEKVRKFYRNGDRLRRRAEEMAETQTWADSAESTEGLYRELVST